MCEATCNASEPKILKAAASVLSINVPAASGWRYGVSNHLTKTNDSKLAGFAKSHILRAGLKTCPPILKGCCCQIMYTMNLIGCTSPPVDALKAIRDYCRAHYFEKLPVDSEESQRVIHCFTQFGYNSITGKGPNPDTEVGATLSTCQSMDDIATATQPEELGVDVAGQDLPPWLYDVHQQKVKRGVMDNLKNVESVARFVVFMTNAAPGTYTVTTQDYLSMPSKELKPEDEAIAVFDHVKVPERFKNGVKVLCVSEKPSPDVAKVEQQIKELTDAHTAEKKQVADFYNKSANISSRGGKKGKKILKALEKDVQDEVVIGQPLTKKDPQNELRQKDEEFLREHALLLEEKATHADTKCMSVYIKSQSLRKALQDKSQVVSTDMLRLDPCVYRQDFTDMPLNLTTDERALKWSLGAAEIKKCMHVPAMLRIDIETPDGHPMRQLYKSAIIEYRPKVDKKKYKEGWPDVFFYKRHFKLTGELWGEEIKISMMLPYLPAQDAAEEDDEDPAAADEHEGVEDSEVLTADDVKMLGAALQAGGGADDDSDEDDSDDAYVSEADSDQSVSNFNEKRTVAENEHRANEEARRARNAEKAAARDAESRALRDAEKEAADKDKKQGEKRALGSPSTGLGGGVPDVPMGGVTPEQDKGRKPPPSSKKKVTFSQRDRLSMLEEDRKKKTELQKSVSKSIMQTSVRKDDEGVADLGEEPQAEVVEDDREEIFVSDSEEEQIDDDATKLQKQIAEAQATAARAAKELAVAKKAKAEAQKRRSVEGKEAALAAKEEFDPETLWEDKTKEEKMREKELAMKVRAKVRGEQYQPPEERNKEGMAALQKLAKAAAASDTSTQKLAARQHTTTAKPAERLLPEGSAEDELSIEASPPPPAPPAPRTTAAAAVPGATTSTGMFVAVANYGQGLLKTKSELLTKTDARDGLGLTPGTKKAWLQEELLGDKACTVVGSRSASCAPSVAAAKKDAKEKKTAAVPKKKQGGKKGNKLSLNMDAADADDAGSTFFGPTPLEERDVPGGDVDVGFEACETLSKAQIEGVKQFGSDKMKAALEKWQAKKAQEKPKTTSSASSSSRVLPSKVKKEKDVVEDRFAPGKRPAGTAGGGSDDDSTPAQKVSRKSSLADEELQQEIQKSQKFDLQGAKAALKPMKNASSTTAMKKATSTTAMKKAP
eukprot:g1513.t1